MKKTILFLINGFGIEQKDSTPIYKSSLMPNLDKLTQEGLFSSVEANDLTLYDAFRTFSIESNKSLTYNFLDNYSSKLKDNPNFNTYLSELDSRVHLFFLVENANSIEHIKNIVLEINKPVILHLILTSEDLANYTEIERIITKVTFDLKQVKIGSIVGLNVFTSPIKDYVRMLSNGVGEKWHEISKKMRALENLKTLPKDVKGFYVNDDFKIDSNDSILIVNYEKVNVTNFISNLNEIYKGKVYSMFPMEGINYPLYVYPISTVSLVKNLKSVNAKGLIITDSTTINSINYCVNGLKNVSDESLLFMKSDNEVLYNKDIMSTVLKDEKFNFIIINHIIDDCKTIGELSAKLNKIDTSVEMIKNICVENKYIFILSSLYGIKKELYEDQYIKKLINFSSKVPMIVLEESINKTNYTIDLGNIIGLKNTALKLMNPEYKGSGLIKKKGFISKLFKK